MYTAMSVCYNQTIPTRVLNERRGNTVSQFREPCMKIISGDADNAKMSFDDNVQAARNQNTCYRYIRNHNMNLKVRRDGKDVHIFRT